MEERSRREIEAARRSWSLPPRTTFATPLASLRLLVESIDDGVATGETRERYLREIRTHVGVLSDLIDDLFELSRIEAGDISWTMRQIEVRRADRRHRGGDARPGRRARRQPRHRAAGWGAGGQRQCREGPARPLQPDPERDPPHPGDGSVTVRARSAAGGVEVEVADDGEGIPAGMASGSSRPSTAATPRAARRAPASAWRSRGRSSKRTAARSGSKMAHPAPGSTSR